MQAWCSCAVVLCAGYSVTTEQQCSYSYCCDTCVLSASGPLQALRNGIHVYRHGLLSPQHQHQMVLTTHHLMVITIVIAVLAVTTQQHHCAVLTVMALAMVTIAKAMI